jgi:2-polyprenyl-6-methoxyphenol hydroxylase-like FAD-dependent oxidoreductase
MTADRITIFFFHQMNPSAGLGAVAAIQDAAILSDLIFHLEDTSQQAISHAFQRYREVRYPIAKQSYETSYQMSHLNEQVGNRQT